VQTLTRELNIAKKVLAEELGDCGVTPVQLLAGQGSNWKGRQQQVLMLQARVRELEQRLKSAESTSSNLMMSTGATSLGYDAFSVGSAASTQRGVDNKSTTATAANRDLQRLQRERREAVERSEKELRELRDEREKLQERLDGAKARAKTLANDNKSLKSQVQTLLEKGRHDDELIASLMRQQERARTLLEEAMEARATLEKAAQGETARQAVQRDQEARVIDRLKEIVADKEAQIRKLQQQVSGRRSGDADDEDNFDQPLPLPMPLTQKVERAVSARPRTASSSGGGGDVGTDRSSGAGASASAAELAELRALLSACEVERDRLRELAGVQETRYQHLLDREAKSAAQLQSTMRRLALLERQLEKSSRQTGKTAQPHPGTSVAIEMPSDAELAALLSDDLAANKESVDRLRDALTACYEEASSLRRALQSALHSKNEDLKMLTDIISQTREQFLAAFKAFKARQ
uniref:GRIP domain-containing protein n=1 Tax=Macrostomum lignano TaxID=282301 RepID=A0A1I8GNM4_9PLAT